MSRANRPSTSTSADRDGSPPSQTGEKRVARRAKPYPDAPPVVHPMFNIAAAGASARTLAALTVLNSIRLSDDDLMTLPVNIGYGNRQQIVSFTPEGDGLHLIRVYNTSEKDQASGGGKDFSEISLLIDTLLILASTTNKPKVLEECQNVEEGRPKDTEIILSDKPLVKFYTESNSNISQIRRMWGNERHNRSVLGGTFRFLEMTYFIRIIELHTKYMLAQKAKRQQRELTGY